MKYLVLFLFVSAAYAQEVIEIKEMELANSAGGFVVLTRDKCKLKAPGYFTHRAYATEGNGAEHEGCWMAPSIADAPKTEGVKIIPIVNTWWDGEVVTYYQSEFSPRLEEKPDGKETIDHIPNSI